MLNRKLVFALLLAGSVLPTCVSAMNADGSVGDGNAAASGNAGGAGAGVGVGTKVNDAIDNVCNIINTPLTLALGKVTAFSTKSKLFITGLLAYLGYCAKDKVVEDVSELPNTVKGLIGGGADCQDGGCRRTNTWTDGE